MTRLLYARIIAFLLIAFFLFACAPGQINFGAPELPADLCQEYDPSNSFFLMVTSAKQMPLNEVYYGFLDITQIGLIAEVVERDKVKKFMLDLGQWYDDHSPVSYTVLIEQITDEAEKIAGITAIVNRRIQLNDYKSPLIISNYDDCLLRAGWNDAMDALLLR